MYSNASSEMFLTLATLGLSDVYVYPAIVFGAIAYLLIMFCNSLVFITIVWNRNLHKPMFMLLINLPISDMVGATAFFPQLVLSIATKNRVISFPACITQAFLIHVYGTANFLILSAMAYDRYIAICYPLRYNTIMTPQTLAKILIIIWFLNFSTVGLLFLLLTPLSFCRTDIVDLFCNNPSLTKLVCEDTRVNNYYGLLTVVLFHGGPSIFLIFTYAQILRTCIMTNQAEAQQKALQTCGSHLTVYLITEFSALITLISHRLTAASPFLRRAVGVLIVIPPPLLDPIIYGLKTKELKEGIIMLLRRNVHKNF